MSVGSAVTSSSKITSGAVATGAGVDKLDILEIYHIKVYFIES